MPARSARLFWRSELDPRVVKVVALPAAGGHADALDLKQLAVRVNVLSGSTGREELLLSDSGRNVRLDVCSGTLLNGPVHLRYRIEGMAELGHKLMTLRRLVALRRLGRFPASLFPAERRAERWILILRVLDALASGASHRHIAAGLFGKVWVGRDWRTHSDFLRLRVQRLARTGTAFVGGGYLKLLKGRPPI